MGKLSLEIHINFSSRHLSPTVNTIHQNNIWQHKPWFCLHILYSVNDTEMSVRKPVFFPVFWLSVMGLSIRFFRVNHRRTCCWSYVCVCFDIHLQCCFIRTMSDSAQFDWHESPSNKWASLNTTHSMQILLSDMTIHPIYILKSQIPSDYTKRYIYTRHKQVEMLGIKCIVRN